jgi:hypothetical protein
MFQQVLINQPPHLSFLTFDTMEASGRFTLLSLVLWRKYSLYGLDSSLIRSERRYERYKRSLPTPGIKPIYSVVKSVAKTHGLMENIMSLDE